MLEEGRRVQAERDLETKLLGKKVVPKSDQEIFKLGKQLQPKDEPPKSGDKLGDLVAKKPWYAMKPKPKEVRKEKKRKEKVDRKEIKRKLKLIKAELESFK